MESSYLDATREAGRKFYQRGIAGPVVMLNLLRFKTEADYSGSPELAPEQTISGKEAYRRYMAHTLPFLKEAGAEVIFMGKGGDFLIGPEAAHWDEVLLVRHASVDKFLAFAQNEGYLKGVGHRTAALADSRLLPIEEQ
jgi:uncharacterized protein (DUF1330 family)